MTHAFTIADDGDEFEKGWWPQWTQQRFPNYETFWQARVVPVTNRVKQRGSVGFLTNEELAESGYTEEDVTNAQLHYTLLMHLGRVFELLDDARAFTQRDYRPNREFRHNEFFESFARLSGASDVADELLARRAEPGKYEPWNETHGRNARDSWRKSNPDPLRPVRAYRNRLVHGRVVPELYVTATDPRGGFLGNMLFYPRLGCVDSYVDWRAVPAQQPSSDFAEAAIVAVDAWEQVVDYVKRTWQQHLLPNVQPPA